MAVRHVFTVEEWHRMGEAGLFGEGARMELVDGEVIEMSPIGSPHAGCVLALTSLLTSLVGDRAVVGVQNPVLLGQLSEPQPDIAVLSPRADWYRTAHPTPSDILLLVEVADTTLAFDRGRKAGLYARAGVRETWVVDLAGSQILVMRAPAPSGYGDIRSVPRGSLIEIEALDDVVISVDDVVGPPH